MIGLLRIDESEAGLAQLWLFLDLRAACLL